MGHHGPSWAIMGHHGLFYIMCVYMYIYIYIYRERERDHVFLLATIYGFSIAASVYFPSQTSGGTTYLSNTTCLIRPCLFYVCLCSVKDHRSLPNYSPLSKKTCVRQVVIDKWFAPKTVGWPMCAVCVRIWCRRPVRIRIAWYIYIYIYMFTCMYL